MKRIFIFLFPFFFHASFAQKADSTAAKIDTFYTKHRANKAAMYSAILPGLGQVYNKKYWKVPVLYAGLVSLAYAIDFNNHYYQIFKKAYLYRIDGDSTTVDDYTKIYPDANALLVRKDYYRRTRDYMYIISGVVYVLNIIDAYVDAQLSDYDISDKLSLHAQPSMQLANNLQPVPMLKLSLAFH